MQRRLDGCPESFFATLHALVPLGGVSLRQNLTEGKCLGCSLRNVHLKRRFSGLRKKVPSLWTTRAPPPSLALDEASRGRMMNVAYFPISQNADFAITWGNTGPASGDRGRWLALPRSRAGRPQGDQPQRPPNDRRRRTLAGPGPERGKDAGRPSGAGLPAGAERLPVRAASGSCGAGGGGRCGGGWFRARVGGTPRSPAHPPADRPSSGVAGPPRLSPASLIGSAPSWPPSRG